MEFFDRKDFIVMTTLAAAMAFAGACSAPKVPVSQYDRVNPELSGKSPEAITRIFNRGVGRSNLHLSLTLWDRAFIESFLKRRAARKSWTEERLKSAIDEWTESFLKGKTSFRVRLDAIDRPLTFHGEDPILELESWRWELWDSEGNRFTPAKVETETKKVFEGTKGRRSFRVDGNIHFSHTIDPSKIRWIRVSAFPPNDEKALEPDAWMLK